MAHRLFCVKPLKGTFPLTEAMLKKLEIIKEIGTVWEPWWIQSLGGIADEIIPKPVSRCANKCPGYRPVAGLSIGTVALVLHHI